MIYCIVTGSGKRPETWATFASCLRDVGLSTFADMIAMKYEDKGSLHSINFCLYTECSLTVILMLYVHTCSMQTCSHLLAQPH